MAVLSFVLSGLALTGSVIAAPQVSFGSASGVVAGKCAGQSCVAADLSGSTGSIPTSQPVGGSAAGWVCVGKYNPEGKAAVDALGPKGGKGKGKGIFGRITEGVLAVEPVSIAVQPRTLVERQLGGRGGFSGACKPNILIYAKGTTESGEFGGTVGPGLKTAMGKQGGGQWTVVGVNYTANSDGNNCVGLPGGMVAKGILESASQKCPNSKIFLSGYSQGAMVVRNAVAYANAKARSQVKGIVTYGDPFNGAPVKGWSGPIMTYCRSTDAVCTGQFKIGAAHLAYSGSADVTNGAKWMVQVAGRS